MPQQQTVKELGARVRSKYPDYADMPDEEVGRRVKAKFPAEYADFSDTPSGSPGIWDRVKNFATSPLLHTEEALRSRLPKEEMQGNVMDFGPLSGVSKEGLAGAGIAGARAVDTLSNPSTLALGGAAGALSTQGLPGMVVGGALSADMLRRGYNEYKNASALPPGSLPREATAGKMSAGIDALFAALPWLKDIPGLRGKAVQETGVRATTPAATAPPVEEAPLIPRTLERAPVADRTPIVEPPPIAPPSTPPSVTSPKPYVRPQAVIDAESRMNARDTAYQEAKAKQKVPDWTEPLPDPNAPKPEPSIADQMAEDRMNQMYDMFTSGIGELSGKAKTSGFGNEMTQEGSFGRIPLKRSFPELNSFKEPPNRIAKAIKKDGNNPLYLEIKNAVKEHIGDVPEPQPDRGYPASWDEEGFADLKDQKGLPMLPINIQGQTKAQALDELVQKILGAEDKSQTSKRDMLGINKKKKPSASDKTLGLFDSSKNKLF